jgi:hypothetical protein
LAREDSSSSSNRKQSRCALGTPEGSLGRPRVLRSRGRRPLRRSGGPRRRLAPRGRVCCTLSLVAIPCLSGRGIVETLPVPVVSEKSPQRFRRRGTESSRQRIGAPRASKQLLLLHGVILDSSFSASSTVLMFAYRDFTQAGARFTRCASLHSPSCDTNADAQSEARVYPARIKARPLRDTDMQVSEPTAFETRIDLRSW